MRKIGLYLGIFIGGGLFGWLVDTGYRSLMASHYAPGTVLPFFSVIYGLGAIMLYILFSVGNIPVLPTVIIGTILCVALEFFGGIISSYVLGHRLWDYSGKPYNVYGFIDLEHALYWFFLTILYKFSHKLFD